RVTGSGASIPAACPTDPGSSTQETTRKTFDRPGRVGQRSATHLHKPSRSGGLRFADPPYPFVPFSFQPAKTSLKNVTFCDIVRCSSRNRWQLDSPGAGSKTL